MSIKIKNLRFRYSGARPFQLKIDHFELKKKERVFLEGPSGSGKTTLLHLIAGMLIPHSGEVLIQENPFSQLSEGRRDQIRGEAFGFVFQNFNLIPYLNVIDNVTLPCKISNFRKKRALEKNGSIQKAAQALLEQLEIPLSAQKENKVIELSMGQQQRVACARALIGNPSILIADEPTSALDYHRKNKFIELLLETSSEQNTAVLFVSHDPTLKNQFDRSVHLKDLQK